MKRVLYLTNIEVPYRVRFFNEFAKYCDLTVLYERKKSGNRNSEWTSSEKSEYQKIFLNGVHIKNESTFSFRILKYIFGNYDEIIVGCYNSPVQMLAILVMKLFHVPYMLNADGELFLSGNSIKTRVKKFFLRGAKKYLVAGEKVAESLIQIVDREKILPYYFSSLSDEELRKNAYSVKERRGDYVLVIGQYFDYKGLDVALRAAKMNSEIHYKFIGMGKRAEKFIEDGDLDGIKNIEIVPFLQKKDLEEEYKKCKMLVLPSRKECWGLVINEAASFGAPIVSTWGSGAAVEFLSDEFPDYLATSGDARELYECIKQLYHSDSQLYSEFLLKKSVNYSIEKSVSVHLQACEIIRE